MIKFQSNPLCEYKHDYEKLFYDIAMNRINEVATYRQLVLNDLFFIVYFVLSIPIANHPFVVERCKKIESLSLDQPTLELWARGHFKTVIAAARTIQMILKNPDICIAKFSHTRPIAKGMLRAIKSAFETSDLLKTCFPEVLWDKPENQAPKWSEDDGIIVKRSATRKESTLEAWGLVEGMPTSKHFDHIDYDDVETDDIVENPDMVIKLRRKFDLSLNLLSKGGTHTVWGTFYTHEGLLTELCKKKDSLDNLIYFKHIVAATDDGKWEGNPIFLTEKENNDLKANSYTYACQQLLNPTPQGRQKLNSEKLQVIPHERIPFTYNFLTTDAAGDDKKGTMKGDAWAMLSIGIEPNLDDLGLSNLYILDAVISPMLEEEAYDEIARMFLRQENLLTIGVEKVALSSTEAFVSMALARRGFYLTEANGGIYINRPGGRSKEYRIINNLSTPLNKNKIFISSKVPSYVVDRLKMEMDKFPYWHDDGIDALSYIYDMIPKYQHSFLPSEEEYVEEKVGRYVSTGY